MTEQEPLTPEGFEFDADKKPVTFLRYHLITLFYGVGIGISSWLIAVILLLMGQDLPYILLDVIYFLMGTLFLLLSTLTLAFGSSPAMAYVKSRLMGTRLEVTPHEITFRRGIRQLLIGILLILFSATGL